MGYRENQDGGPDPSCVILHASNDSLDGNKYVFANRVSETTALWSDGELLKESRQLVRLDNAPIRKDGRVAYLETIFSFEPVSAAE